MDDYWISYGNTGPDPYIVNGWTEHTADCTADFMGTSQSKFDLPDGATAFYFDSSGAPLYDYAWGNPPDGCYGMRLFAESRGYTVTTDFSQFIQGYPGTVGGQGFTFANYMAEIDAGRPVLIQVEGHSMIGYGYNATSNIVYIHNTWNHSFDIMTWGGSYSGMQQYGVTVLRLSGSPSPPPCRFWGNVRVDGNLVAKGTGVKPVVPGVGDAILSTWTAYTGSVEGQGDADYLITVPADDPETPAKDGGLAGDTITFWVFFGGVWCLADQSHGWETAGFIQLDLTATSVDEQPPPAPTLVWPAAGGSTNLRAVPLDWSDVTDSSLPVKYNVRVDDNADFSSPEASASDLTGSNYTTPNLAVGTYYWRVNARDSASPPNVSAWSTAWSCTIDLTPPPAPSLVSPTNGTIAANTKPALDWSDVSDPSGVTYSLQMDNNSDFSSPEVNVSGLTSSAYTPTTALANDAYYWHVKAVDGAGNSGAWSASWTLTVFSGIFLTSPNGGESWATGSTQTITWSYTGNPGAYVKIEPLKSGVVNRVITSSRSIGSGGSGSYSWLVPSTQTGGDDYQVRITSTTNAAITDTSGNFTITGPTITVVSPNGDESWPAGTYQTIKWSYTGSPGAYVKIELLKNGGVNRVITSSRSIGSNGSSTYSWLIPSSQTQGSDYKVRVTSTTNSAISDSSDNNFAITPPPPAGLTVASPNGGQRSGERAPTRPLRGPILGIPGPM